MITLRHRVGSYSLWSLLLVLGDLTLDLTSELVYYVWILLLHLLTELLARLDETGQVLLQRASAGSPQGVELPEIIWT